MSLCNLCRSNKATQDGSHIASCFIIASQVGKRGEEKSYLITTDPNQDFNKNMGDQGLKQDKLFCPSCEKRFGMVENFYSSEITNKIEEEKFTANFDKKELKNGHYKLNCIKIHPIAFQLFIQSIIWRASISTEYEYEGFKLGEILDERIRFNLDLFLPQIINFKPAQSPKEWLIMIESCKILFEPIPFALIKAKNIEDKTYNYTLFYDWGYPFQVILNEYFIYMFDGSLKWLDDPFWLQSEFEINEILNSTVSDAKIAIIPNKLYFKIIKEIEESVGFIRTIEAIKQLQQAGIPLTNETVREKTINALSNPPTKT